MYRIGELASLLGIKPDTLRFYEKHQLLSPSQRSSGGYRLYSGEDRQRLAFILRAKQAGFSLTEIRELLAIRVKPDAFACHDVKQIAEDKMALVEAKMAHLQQIHRALHRISVACCGGPESAAHCTILEALDHDSDTRNTPEVRAHEPAC